MCERNEKQNQKKKREKEKNKQGTHEGALSRRVGSILRDDGEGTVVRMLILLLRLQKVVVATMAMLVSDQGRVGHDGSSRIVWWYPFAAHAQAAGAT